MTYCGQERPAMTGPKHADASLPPQANVALKFRAVVVFMLVSGERLPAAEHTFLNSNSVMHAADPLADPPRITCAACFADC